MTTGGPRCTAALHKRSRPASTSRKRRELPVNPGQAQPTSLRRFTPASPAGKTATHVSASTATKGDAATGHDDDQSMQPSSRETEGANDDDVFRKYGLFVFCHYKSIGFFNAVKKEIIIQIVNRFFVSNCKGDLK